MEVIADFVVEDDTFLEYQYQGKSGVIHFSDLNKYWNYATADDFEGGSFLIQNNLIIGTMLVAQGQGGIIYVWDAEKDELIHISEGSYTVAIALANQTIYNLALVSNFMTKAHFIIEKRNLGIMDAFFEGERLTCEIPCTPDDYNGDMNTINLAVLSENLCIILNDKEYVVKESVN